MHVLPVSVHSNAVELLSIFTAAAECCWHASAQASGHRHDLERQPPSDRLRDVPAALAAIAMPVARRSALTSLTCRQMRPGAHTVAAVTELARLLALLPLLQALDVPDNQLARHATPLIATCAELARLRSMTFAVRCRAAHSQCFSADRSRRHNPLTHMTSAAAPSAMLMQMPCPQRRSACLRCARCASQMAHYASPNPQSWQMSSALRLMCQAWASAPQRPARAAASSI